MEKNEQKSLPYTASGLWQVQNYTRYRTEDLLDVCSAVENVYKQQSLALGNNGELTRQRHHDPDTAAVLIFDNYAKVDVPTGWRGQQRAKMLVKVNWREIGVRIVPPEKLNLSPLEMLAGATQDRGTRVPETVVCQLMDAVANYYSIVGNGYHGNLHDDLKRRLYSAAVPLHFVEKVAAKKPVKESGDVRLKRLSADRAREALWAMGSLCRDFEDVERKVGAANGYAGKRNIPEYVLPEEVAIVKAAIARLRDRLQCVTSDLEVLP